jgi:CO dehydrogenase nickel-insertion accessory protein CooC1
MKWKIYYNLLFKKIYNILNKFKNQLKQTLNKLENPKKKIIKFINTLRKIKLLISSILDFLN